MTSLPERFWQKVDLSGGWASCWTWTGGHHSQGYGIFNLSGQTKYAHRLSWEDHAGEPIPAGMSIDHLCRNRACVNPSHLEVVTPRVNSLRGMSPNALRARQTHCIHGHPFDAENTYVRREGWRMCKACRREGMRRSSAA